jgi:hypothetical protein
MTPIVLDTDVVSFLFKADNRAQLYLPHLNNRRWFDPELALSTRIRNYGYVSKDRSLTVAALSGSMVYARILAIGGHLGKSPHF